MNQTSDLYTKLEQASPSLLSVATWIIVQVSGHSLITNKPRSTGIEFEIRWESQADKKKICVSLSKINEADTQFHAKCYAYSDMPVDNLEELQMKSDDKIKVCQAVSTWLISQLGQNYSRTK